jgi:hypothetical protein
MLEMVETKMKDGKLHDPNEFLMLWQLQAQSNLDLLENKIRSTHEKTFRPLMDSVSDLDTTLHKQVIKHCTNME